MISTLLKVPIAHDLGVMSSLEHELLADDSLLELAVEGSGVQPEALVNSMAALTSVNVSRQEVDVEIRKAPSRIRTPAQRRSDHQISEEQVILIPELEGSGAA